MPLPQTMNQWWEKSVTLSPAKARDLGMTVAFPRSGLTILKICSFFVVVHHKMVDDQHETYTADLLKLLRKIMRSGFLRLSRSKPKYRMSGFDALRRTYLLFLTRVLSGQEIINIAGGAYGSLFDYEEPISAAETEMIADFLQEVQDWAELWDEIEAGERVKATFGLTEKLHQLEEAGLWVFGLGKCVNWKGDSASVAVANRYS